ncbi:helix-turn-helix domain-containing protein [Agrobacterium tumefaciens]|uniref:Helix-turn-helix transcriptional regulator n=1 Tax=Agrobacterium tumefaciens TaxID=358 RepID=A0AA44JAC8_AGRTU|nr:helix-turn-helix transcriptional regulator [Agrobacterium tumefaciens]NTB87648.1 helix-turn-helix transcriptional regulator [Agrobacterium tumefaciens]NTC19984.1 helix-turn-helix transcriptional regulator [Agrobacterium tumefaciens]NTC29803.1 helix-turn-helix transcriptional regulator [Agrobacterium tumefaciens]
MLNKATVPHAIDVEVGSRIRVRRKILGMSQTQLAESLGVTFQQVQKYEKGSNRIGASRLQNMAEILSVPISYFFGESALSSIGFNVKTELSEGSDLTAFVETPEATELNLAFSKIKSPIVRKRIVVLLKSIADALKPQ